MNLPTQYHAFAKYNRWMNEKLYALAATLPDEARKRDMGAFFRSIHGTLNHLLLTDRGWLSRFTADPAITPLITSLDTAGNPIRVRSLDQELYSDFETLRRERGKPDTAIEKWVGTLTLERLAESIKYVARDGREHEHPLWWAITHFFNHQTHHRGQITTLIKQLGKDPGVTDLIVMLLSSRG